MRFVIAVGKFFSWPMTSDFVFRGKWCSEEGPCNEIFPQSDAQKEKLRTEIFHMQIATRWKLPFKSKALRQWTHKLIECKFLTEKCTFYTDQWFPIIYGSITFFTHRQHFFLHNLIWIRKESCEWKHLMLALNQKFLMSFESQFSRKSFHKLDAPISFDWRQFHGLLKSKSMAASESIAKIF